MAASRLARLAVPHTTHDVLNQSSIFFGNAFAGDVALRAAVKRFLPAAASEAATTRLSSYGAWAGSADTQHKAYVAQRLTPELRNYDRNGFRRDDVAYHPFYTDVYSHAVAQLVPSYAWRHGQEAGAHIVRAALSMLHYTAEPGSSCPLTMTFAAIPALRISGDAFGDWIEKGLGSVHDPRDVPSSSKASVVFGMSMTEKAGGSDVRSNTTTAVHAGEDASPTAAGEPGAAYLLRGHKWFTSAPGSDAFLTLAYTGGSGAATASAGPTGKPASVPDRALSCFLVPRWLPDGSRNSGFLVMRLKEKLGDRSNASSEVQYDNAAGYLVGRLGRGVPTIMEMVVHTRLDCALGSAGLMRQVTRNALHYAVGRSAFGGRLIDAPAMRAVLADLCVEGEAAVATSMYMAHCFDECVRSPDDAEAQAFRRLATAVAKYYICKRAPEVAYEALEGIGGNGYVEEWHMPRLFRQSPLNSVWEGSGNVIALDILRTCGKEPAALKAFTRRVASTAKAHPALAAHAAGLMALAADPAAAANPLHARYFAESLALALQGHALAGAAAADPALAPVLDLWAALRLGGGPGKAPAPVLFGAVPPGAAGAASGASAASLIGAVLDREVAGVMAAVEPARMA